MSHSKQKGFSLVEASVVLLVMALIAGGAISLMSAERSTEDLVESRERTIDLKQQLMKFLMVNSYLPCPDTDGDGYEDRSATNHTCQTQSGKSRPYGNVPYHDLGIKLSDARDKWGNFVRYAVNAETTQAYKICDYQSSASYFCNQSAPAFSLQDTPPVAGNRGTGNFYVCNESASSCSGTPNSNNLLKDEVSVVLVAYNEDGHETLANCSSATGASKENCDDDLYYHQAQVTVTDNAMFDDFIQTISGYEIKRSMYALASIPIGNQPIAAGTPIVLTGDDIINAGDTAYVGAVGDNNAYSDNVTVDSNTQNFDFGAENAGATVELTLDTVGQGTWDQGGSYTQDRAYIRANGDTKQTLAYDKNNNSVGSTTADGDLVGRAWNSESNRWDPTWSQSRTYEVTADENGQVQLDFAVATTGTDETVSFTNIVLTLYWTGEEPEEEDPNSFSHP